MTSHRALTINVCRCLTVRLVIGSDSQKKWSMYVKIEKREFYLLSFGFGYFICCMCGWEKFSAVMKCCPTKVNLADKARVSNPCCGSPRKDILGVLNFVLFSAVVKYCHLVGLSIYRAISFGLDCWQNQNPRIQPRVVVQF